MNFNELLQASELAVEVVQAAEAIRRPGALALDHKQFATCNFGDTVPSCMEIGMQSPYDCSGYVISVLSRVLGRVPEEWPQDRRHVRQMHKMSNDQLPQWEQFGLGNLAVLGRAYTLDGQDRLVPAHIGIVIERNADRRMLKLAHAQAKLGCVTTAIVSFDSPECKLLGMITPERLIS